MDSRTKERVERWDSRPFSGGYDGLADLADDEFSGAVEAGGTWLFLLNGRIVGIVDGDLEDVEDASGTVYTAPHPSVPLLCSMEERGGETRAKYYTNETPLREVDETLRDGSFTGYVELSENVLSGDYYAVYYGGRRMAAAYIGSAERLLTGEEAFERAADEVGIYEVIDVDVDVTDVPRSDPEPETGSDDGPTGITGRPDESDAREDDGAGITRSDSSGADSDPSGTDTDTSGTEPTEAGSTTGAAAESGTPGGADGDVPTDEPTDRAAAETGSEDARIEVDEAEPAATADDPAGSDPEPSDGRTASSSPTPEEVEAAADELEVDGAPWTTSDDDEGELDASVGSAGGSPGSDGASNADSDGPAADERSAGDLDERFKQEERWRETRSIPSLDPERSESSETGDRSRGRRSSASGSESGPRRRSNATSGGRSAGGRSSASGSTGRPEGAAASGSTGSAGRERASREDLASRVEALSEARDRLKARCEELEAERDRLEGENEELSTTVERLRDRIEELEAELEGRAGGDRGVAGGTDLEPRRALAETNLFVRYDSKSKPTLVTARDGEAGRAEVDSNLRLEHHTTFDAADATVGGTPYEEFLPTTLEYQFVDWLVGTLLYEIRNTGRSDGLGDLYDAIPRIDRAELGATISLDDDETEDVPDEVTFDVVAFDKRGTPLVVASLDDSRDPVSGTTLERVEEHASAVCANYPDLAAALVVTSSFFDPDALEVVERATEGGFLSRSSNLSYVNVSRKRGYHLCLVESRAGGFHVNVPEL